MPEKTNVASWQPDVFEYLDLPRFLQDYRTRARRAGVGRHYTYAWFARWAELGSRGHVHQIFNGGRPLMPDRARLLAPQLFRHLEGEPERYAAATGYFIRLAEFSNAQREFENSLGESAFRALRGLLDQRTRFRQGLHRPDSDVDALVYLANWWRPVVRQFAWLPGFEPTMEWIRRHTWVKTEPPADLAQSMEAARARGELDPPEKKRQRGDRRSMSLGHDLGRFGERVRLAAASIHVTALERVRDALFVLPREQRHLNLKFLVTRAERLADFEREIKLLIDRYNDEEDGDTVFQLHFSVIPLNRKAEP